MAKRKEKVKDANPKKKKVEELNYFQVSLPWPYFCFYMLKQIGDDFKRVVI